MENETYTMAYVCKNCGTEYSKEIEKGRNAKGNGGKCPYCGVVDSNNHFFRPQEVFRKRWGLK